MHQMMYPVFNISVNASEKLSRYLNSKILCLHRVAYLYVGYQCFSQHLIDQIHHLYQPVNTNLGETLLSLDRRLKKIEELDDGFSTQRPAT